MLWRSSLNASVRMGVLHQVFGSDPSFHLVPEAVGAALGRATLLVSDRHVLSTLSESWLSKVRRSGRFAGAQWRAGYEVTVHDAGRGSCPVWRARIRQGRRRGLRGRGIGRAHQPVRSGSIEFAAEALETTFRCVDRLVRLADYRFQLSLQESTSFWLPDWQGAPEVTSALDPLAREWQDPFVWGDVYFAHAHAPS